MPTASPHSQELAVSEDRARDGLALAGLLPPPLVTLAAVAAAASVAVNRGLLRTLGAQIEPSQVATARQLGALPRNLAVVAAFVALAWAVRDFARFDGVGRLFGRRTLVAGAARVGISGFAALFLVGVLFAAVAPVERSTTEGILLSAAAGSCLAGLIGVAATRWRASYPLRAGLVATTMAVTAGFASLVVSIGGIVLSWAPSYALAASLRALAELAYLAVPFLLLPSVLPPRGRPRLPGLALLGGHVAGAALLLIGWQRMLGPDFDNVFYGMTHLELLLDSAPLLYALPLGLSVGGAMLGLPRPETRQVAAVLLLLAASGFAPRSPEQVLYLALAVALVARAAVADANLRVAASFLGDVPPGKNPLFTE